MGTAAREVLGDRFYDLLEAGAKEARHSLQLLAVLLKAHSDSMEELRVRLQEESDRAETPLEGVVRDLHRRQDDPLKLVVAKDLSDRLQSILEACRDAANLVYRVVLKHT